MLHSLGFPAHEGMKDQLYSPLFHSTVISSSCKTRKQDSNCDLVGLKYMGIAKVKMFGHLQDVQVSSAEPTSKQAIPRHTFLSLHDLFSGIFIKFTFMLLALTVERKLLKQSISLLSVLWHGCLSCHCTWKVKTSSGRPLLLKYLKYFRN